MKNFDKLFLHLFTKGIEYYKDTRGTLKAIDNVLNTPEEILWQNLQQAYNQVHRLNVLKEHGIDTALDEPIETDIPEELIQLLLKEIISLDDLKRNITKQIEKR